MGWDDRAREGVLDNKKRAAEFTPTAPEKEHKKRHSIPISDTVP